MTTETNKFSTERLKKLWQTRDATAVFRTPKAQDSYLFAVAIGLGITLFEVFLIISIDDRIRDIYRGIRPSIESYALPLVVFISLIVLVYVRESIVPKRAHLQESMLRLQLAYKYMSSNQTERSKDSTGKQADLSNTGVEKIALYRSVFLPEVTVSLISPFLVALFIGSRYSGLLCFVLLCMIPIVPITMLIFMSTTRKTSSDSRKARSKLASNYLEALQNLRTLVLLNAAGRKSDELQEIGENNRQALMELLRGNQMIILVMDAVISLAIICVGISVAFYQASQGTLPISDFFPLLLLLLLFLEPINHVGAFFYVGMVGIALQRVVGRLIGDVPEDIVRNEIGILRQEKAPGSCMMYTVTKSKNKLNEETQEDGAGLDLEVHEFNDNYSIPPITLAESEATGGACYGERPKILMNDFLPVGIRLKNVTFYYNSECEEPAVIGNLSAEFKPGSHTAIIGPSGQGKSTLLSLLSGDLEPVHGNIGWLDYENSYCGSQTAQSLQERTAYVGQTTWLFTGTIAYNLQLGNPAATEQEMWDALKKVNLDKEVREFPMELMTHIGERGTGLSGGQAQRLSIARALLSRRPILLLDEPTSQVDPAAEAEIMQVLKNLGNDLTIIMITHRMTSTAAMDTVLELQQHLDKDGHNYSKLVITNV